MNIIIIGAGEVGTHLATMLAKEYHDVTVIDPDTQKLEELSAVADVITIEGSATSISVLHEANIKRADLFIAVATSEETNIVAATVAKRLGAKKSIARIDRHELLLPANKEIFLNMGIDSLIYPEKLAAQEVITLLDQTISSDFVDFAGGKLSLLVIKLDEESPLLGKTLQQCTPNAINLDYRAVAISRDGTTIIPRATDVFELGDQVYISVTADNVVVANAEVESSLAMPRIYLGCRTGLVRAHCRTVNHYQGYLPHDCTNRAELMAVNTVMAKLIIAFQFNFFIISSLYLSLLTHHSSLKAELESQPLSAPHNPSPPRR